MHVRILVSINRRQETGWIFLHPYTSKWGVGKKQKGHIDHLINNIANLVLEFYGFLCVHDHDQRRDSAEIQKVHNIN